ncbi:MerR family transcriptional regulator [Catenulispora pinisilvae]|uniref:MerR family transcriptional regulator n=1 Tax=Catenulispora pinisilvae TaxID=2705253 RepID=UPI0018915495|nr:MerR family transcriptional regulator [Catenulispora pinisilvae]
MRIGELATRSGVSVRALRYYEEQGLLIAERSISGQRHYPETALEKVGFFQDMYSAGLTSKRIAELMPCFNTGHTDAEQRIMLRTERDRIHERVTQLTSALRRLDEVIAVADTHP